MSSLTLNTYTMPGATLQGENPLPPLIPLQTPSAASIAHNSGNTNDYPDRGVEHHILPYRLQDQYDRERRPRAFKVAILENEFLRATFLLELGGRLWSLLHKPSNRELLYVNPVFQPANLSVRDAWFAGGVEWNIGIIGHCPFTCSPLFAAKTATDDGAPVLRLYEFERIRGIPFQIDFYLPDGLPFLLVRPRIVNPNDHVVPMYWWSNIAVPERPDVRVIGPADQAYRHDYDGSLKAHGVPIHEGVDITYTTNRRTAADMYLRIPQGHRPWIAALDKDGKGLVQTSTGRLYGRKAFNWGMGPGGRHWQEFLAKPGEAYIEIQGGLAPTQACYIPMPPGAQWDWLEAYGLMEASPATVHGKVWAQAYQSVEEQLKAKLPSDWMDAELARSQQWARRSPAEVLQVASGWGALEQRRRTAAGEPRLPESMPFPDASLGEEQSPWLQLLQTGVFPERQVNDAPGAYMVQRQWFTLLEKAAEQSRNSHWLAWLHLGVMRFRAQDFAGAREAWERSMQLQPSAWACRNLAILAKLDGDLANSACLMEKAHHLLPSQVSLAIECCRAMVAARRFHDVSPLVQSASKDVGENGRVRLLVAKAALELGNLAKVAEFLQGPSEIANIREQEVSLSDLWFSWHEKQLASKESLPIDDALRRRVRREFPPPARFDFRISARDLAQ